MKTFLSLFLFLSFTAHATYFTDGFLRQGNAELCRKYLGVTNSSGGTVTNFTSGNANPLFSTSVLNPAIDPLLLFTLNYVPATNSYAGIVSALGYQPATNGASGTVTNFQAGNSTPLFTTSVSSSTTYPSLTFNLLYTPVNIAGDVMTGRLTNRFGFYGDGIGLTNIPLIGLPAFMSATTNSFIYRITDQMLDTTTITDDDTLSFTLAENEKSEIDIMAKFVAGSVGADGIKITVTNTASGGFLLVHSTVVKSTGGLVLEASQTTYGAANTATSTDSDTMVEIKGIMAQGGSSGTIIFQWSKNANAGDGLTIKSNSYIRITKF